MYCSVQEPSFQFFYLVFVRNNTFSSSSIAHIYFFVLAREACVVRYCECETWLRRMLQCCQSGWLWECTAMSLARASLRTRPPPTFSAHSAGSAPLSAFCCRPVVANDESETRGFSVLSNAVDQLTPRDYSSALYQWTYSGQI